MADSSDFSTRTTFSSFLCTPQLPRTTPPLSSNAKRLPAMSAWGTQGAWATQVRPRQQYPSRHTSSQGRVAPPKKKRVGKTKRGEKKNALSSVAEEKKKAPPPRSLPESGAKRRMTTRDGLIVGFIQPQRSPRVSFARWSVGLGARATFGKRREA